MFSSPRRPFHTLVLYYGFLAIPLFLIISCVLAIFLYREFFNTLNEPNPPNHAPFGMHEFLAAVIEELDREEHRVLRAAEAG